jgi:hypothetical protein
LELVSLPTPAGYDEEAKKRGKKEGKRQLCERKEGSGTHELPHTTSLPKSLCSRIELKRVMPLTTAQKLLAARLRPLGHNTSQPPTLSAAQLN